MNISRNGKHPILTPANLCDVQKLIPATPYTTVNLQYLAIFGPSMIEYI